MGRVVHVQFRKQRTKPPEQPAGDPTRIRWCGDCQCRYQAGWEEPCKSCIPVVNSNWRPDPDHAWELWAYTRPRVGPVHDPLVVTGTCPACDGKGEHIRRHEAIQCPWCTGTGEM